MLFWLSPRCWHGHGDRFESTSNCEDRILQRPACVHLQYYVKHADHDIKISLLKDNHFLCVVTHNARTTTSG